MSKKRPGTERESGNRLRREHCHSPGWRAGRTEPFLRPRENRDLIDGRIAFGATISGYNFMKCEKGGQTGGSTAAAAVATPPQCGRRDENAEAGPASRAISGSP